MGKSQSQKVFFLLTLVMQHLIKLHAASTSRDAAHWYQEASNFQASARKAFSPGMKQLIDTNEAWADAWHGTHRFLNYIGSDLERSTEACPLTLDELLARPFDIDAAAAKLASAEGHSDGGISHDPQ